MSLPVAPTPIAARWLSKARSLALTTALKRTIVSSPSFFFTALFIFLEYVRPMAMYPAIAVLPWGRITMILALITCVLEGKGSFKIAVGWVLIAAFTGCILLSTVTALYPAKAIDGLNLWLSWLIAMYIVSSAADSEEKLILLFGGFLLWNFKMSLSAFKSFAMGGFQFRDWGVTGSPGWFTNSGEFGIEMCVFFPMIIYFYFALQPYLNRWKQWGLLFIAVTAVVGMVASSSRGAVLGGGVVGLWFLFRSPHRVKGFLAIAVLSGLTWLILPSENKARWASAGQDTTSQLRIQYWKDGIEIANNFPLFGIGFENWIPYYRAYYNPKGQLPHNIFIECMAQLGYVGLTVFLALIAYTFWENYRTRRIAGPEGSRPNRFAYFMSFGLDGALLGYLASGFFVTVLFYPYFWMNIAFTIALASFARAKRRSIPGGFRVRLPAQAAAPSV